MALPRPCLDCGALTAPGHSRCPAHDYTLGQAKRERRGATPTARAERRRLNLRGFGQCAECGVWRNAEVLEVDHIVAIADGGSDTRANLQLLCHGCHVGKTAREARARP